MYHDKNIRYEPSPFTLNVLIAELKVLGSFYTFDM